MAVRFVIGRAGTGKTTLCMREMRAEMARDALAGGALLWIVPEQGTFSAERLLLTGAAAPGEAPVARGMFRGQVLGFRRLAMLIAQETGLLAARSSEEPADEAGSAGVPSTIKPMDEIARAVLLEEVIRREKGKLTVFRAAAERPGFAAKLDATLRELRQHGHSGTSLRELVNGGERGGLDAVMSRKLLDLAILLDAWAIEIEKSGNWDFEQIMHAAALKVGESPLIMGTPGANEAARIWVDAFSAMSALEIRMLAALGLHAHQVTITLLADPDAPAIGDLRESHESSTGLFSRTERLYRRMVDEFRRHQVRVGPMVPLRERFRFVDAGIARIEAQLFDEGARAQAGESPGLPSGAPLQSGVQIWTCSDPETEARAVAREIRRLIIPSQDDTIPPLRCRQIGVIVPDLEGYHDALRRAFTECAIPHFIDRRRGIAHHPLVELLRSAVGVVTSRWDQEEMMLYLKSGLAGVSHDDVSLVENYLIEHGISHVPWDRAWTWIAPNQSDDDADERIPESARQRLHRANLVREKVWTNLRGFVEQCTAASADSGGAHFVQALQQLLKSLDTATQLRTWIAAAQKNGDTELAQIHEQAAREVDRILILLADLLQNRPRTLEDFARLLENALEQLTLGLIPPTVDQVLVSSVARSRVPEMEVVFVLGAVEGQFPKVVEEDPILSDDQRAAFNAHAADPIGEGSDRRLLEMPFLDYVALTRGRRSLILCHPLADRRGKALAPSRHLARLRKLLGPAITDRSFDADSHVTIAGMGTPQDLLMGVAGWARHTLQQSDQPGRKAPSSPKDDTLPAAYNRLAISSDPALSRNRQLVWRAIAQSPDPVLSKELADGLHPLGTPLRLSVSRLERFAACPLQYFMHYSLALRLRAEFELDNLGMGQLQHSILERVYRQIIAKKFDWPADRAALAAALGEEIDAASAELHAELAEQTAGYDKLRARLNRVLGILLEADRRRALQGDFRPDAVELYFGKGATPRRQSGRLVSLPLLTIPAATGGREVHLDGKIDRMDQSPGGDAAVIDYKSSSNKSMELPRVLHGLSLQLPVYALAMRELAGASPAAALYFNLGLHLERIDHAGEAQMPDTDEFYQQFQPRGLVDASRANLLDRALKPETTGNDGGGKSAWYKLRFNNDGQISGTGNDLLSNGDFTNVLEYVRWKLAQLAADLAGGRIAPDPYRAKQETPCERCDFRSLCPFDRVAGLYRDVPALKRDDALAAMHAAQR